MFIIPSAKLTKVINLTSTSNNVNVFAQAGSPSYPITVIMQVNANVSSNNRNTAAFETGQGWANGSFVYIDNNAFIKGAPATRQGAQGNPGAGGRGGSNASAGHAGTNGGKGSLGSQGGPAVLFNTPTGVTIVLNNETGTIVGGPGANGGPGGLGGGGGGGGRTITVLDPETDYYVQYTGCGGQGFPGGNAGGEYTGNPGDLAGGDSVTTFFYGVAGDLLSPGKDVSIHGIVNNRSANGGNLGASGVSANFSGGSPGSTGATGDIGKTGLAVLGNANVIYVATGSISGQRTNSTTFTYASDNIRYVGANTYVISSTAFIPPSCNAGDIAILFDLSLQQDNGTTKVAPEAKTIPSGWTEIVDNTADNSVGNYDMRSTVSYKILAESDINSTITGLALSSYKTMLFLRTNELINNLVIQTVASNSSTSAIANVQFDMTGQTGPTLIASHFVKAIRGSTGRNSYAVGANTFIDTPNAIGIINNTSQLVGISLYDREDFIANCNVRLDSVSTTEYGIMQAFFIKVN